MVHERSDSIRRSDMSMDASRLDPLLEGGDGRLYEIMDHFQYVFSKLKDC